MFPNWHVFQVFPNWHVFQLCVKKLSSCMRHKNAHTATLGLFDKVRGRRAERPVCANVQRGAVDPWGEALEGVDLDVHHSQRRVRDERVVLTKHGHRVLRRALCKALQRKQSLLRVRPGDGPRKGCG